MCLCKIILKLCKLSIQPFQLDHLTNSFGMENYLREDTVTDDKGYEEWQEAYLASQF